MYIERYVCGESSKLTIGANSKSSFLNFIVFLGTHMKK